MSPKQCLNVTESLFYRGKILNKIKIKTSFQTLINPFSLVAQIRTHTHLFRVYLTMSVQLKWYPSISFCSLYMFRHIGSRNLLHNSAFPEISFHNTFFGSHFLTVSSTRVQTKPRARQHTVTDLIKEQSYKHCYFESLLTSHLCRQSNT